MGSNVNCATSSTLSWSGSYTLVTFSYGCMRTCVPWSLPRPALEGLLIGWVFLCACLTYLVSYIITTCASVSSITFSRSDYPVIVLVTVRRLQQFQVTINYLYERAPLCISGPPACAREVRGPRSRASS
eukprot:5187331-Pyramimonas_sp.AAC.1